MLGIYITAYTATRLKQQTTNNEIYYCKWYCCKQYYSTCHRLLSLCANLVPLAVSYVSVSAALVIRLFMVKWLLTMLFGLTGKLTTTDSASVS